MTSEDEVARRSAGALWATDNASRGLGMQLADIGPGRASLTMTVRADMVNGHGCCHGGLVATLADSAFAFACNSRGTATVIAEFRGRSRSSGRPITGADPPAS